MKSLFRLSIPVLWIVLLLNCTLSAIINGEIKAVVNPNANIKCGDDEIVASSEDNKVKVCIKKCTIKIFNDCKDPFGDFSLSQNTYVCGYNQETATYTTFQDTCQACQTPNIAGYKAEKCSGIVKQIDVGIALDKLNMTQVLPGVPICNNFELYTKERGCIKACFHPDFKKCGDVFPALYDPKFCALNKNGSWSSFTYACQACPNSYQNTQFVGVANGKCEEKVVVVPSNNTVKPTKCKNDTECIQSDKCFLGNCISRCSGMFCKEGTKCSNGKCIEIAVPQCTSDKNCKSFQTCTQGKCTQKFYPCGSSFCKPSQKCIFNTCTPSTPPVDPCSSISCKKGQKCKNGICQVYQNSCNNKCSSTQICTNGKCIDVCLGVRCSIGKGCQDGQCVQLHKDVGCKNDGQCGLEDICYEGKCVNACSSVRCGLGRCQHGNCQTVVPKTTQFTCPQPRPNKQQTCPTLYYIRAPDLYFCIIDQNGIWRAYARECSICQDKAVTSYNNAGTTIKQSAFASIYCPMINSTSANSGGIGGAAAVDLSIISGSNVKK